VGKKATAMTPPYALREPEARAWLTELVVAHELAEGLGDLPTPDGGQPPIGMAWSPTALGEEDAVHLLVRAAQDEGVISKPSHTGPDFEYIDDGDRGRYRWLLDLTAPTPLKLATLSTPLHLLNRGGAVGITAALVILHEAVEAANLLLHQLSDYVSAIVPGDGS
jgi:hypothetical protein